MECIDEGHQYKLSNGETLTFIKRVGGELVHDGVQNEEIIEVLLNRMAYLQSKFSCRENALAITKLQEALLWLNERTRLRVAQGVETKDIAHKS